MQIKRENDRLFRQYVRSHYRGEMQLSECLKLVQPTLLPMATSLRRRWTPSAAFDVEDVQQEMMLALVTALQKYRARWGNSTVARDKKGPRADLGNYCMYYIHDKAKKRLHKERGANLHGNSDKNKSRIPKFFDDVSRPKMGDAPRAIETVVKALVVAPVQDAAVENHEVWTRILRKSKSSAVKWGMLALQHANGEKVLAAKALYSDPKVRLHLQLGCERDAEKVIAKAWDHLSAA
jgi:hypothetical protein